MKTTKISFSICKLPLVHQTMSHRCRFAYHEHIAILFGPERAVKKTVIHFGLYFSDNGLLIEHVRSVPWVSREDNAPNWSTNFKLFGFFERQRIHTVLDCSNDENCLLRTVLEHVRGWSFLRVSAMVSGPTGSVYVHSGAKSTMRRAYVLHWVELRPVHEWIRPVKRAND